VASGARFGVAVFVSFSSVLVFTFGAFLSRSTGLSTFLFTVAPLRVKGGTGSRVNPIATF
jgi:hypothetical protein